MLSNVPLWPARYNTEINSEIKHRTQFQRKSRLRHSKRSQNDVVKHLRQTTMGLCGQTFL